jgi:hypothetical protein
VRSPGELRNALDTVVTANRGIAAVEVDGDDPASIAAVGSTLLRDYTT